MSNADDTNTPSATMRRQFVHDSAPAPELLLGEMFDFIAHRLCPQNTTMQQAVRRWIDDEHENIQDGCASRSDHTLLFTREFIRARGLDEDGMISWLKSFYGNPRCDCRVLLDVGIYWLRGNLWRELTCTDDRP